MMTRRMIRYRVIWADEAGRRRAWETPNELEAHCEAAIHGGEVVRETWHAVRVHQVRSPGTAADEITSPRPRGAVRSRRHRRALPTSRRHSRWRRGAKRDNAAT